MKMKIAKMIERVDKVRFCLRSCQRIIAGVQKHGSLIILHYEAHLPRVYLVQFIKMRMMKRKKIKRKKTQTKKKRVP